NIREERLAPLLVVRPGADERDEAAFRNVRHVLGLDLPGDGEHVVYGLDVHFSSSLKAGQALACGLDGQADFGAGLRMPALRDRRASAMPAAMDATKTSASTCPRPSAGMEPPGQKPVMPQPMPNTAEPAMSWVSKSRRVGTWKCVSNT